MNTYVNQVNENKSQSVANTVSQKQNKGESTFQFVNNRPEAIQAAKLQKMANNHSDQQQQYVQKKENNTGLPDNLKSGIENLSGYSMNDVKVHYNSSKPAQLQAHAYAQGTNIHLASGQERHLPHEAWHVVQQKQGRVKPTMQLKGKVNVNDDTGLENEADVMGAKALQMQTKNNVGGFNAMRSQVFGVAQRMLVNIKDKVGDGWTKKNVKRTFLVAAINRGIKQSLIPGKYTIKASQKIEINKAGEAAIDKLMEVYAKKPIYLNDFNSLIHQVSQDLHMLAEGNDKLVGIGHQHSEFTYNKDLNDSKKKDVTLKSGLVESDQRVYRTMTKKDWENNHISGHGGSIGQAMHYFNLGKKAHTKGGDREPDMLVEFTFTGKKLNDLVSKVKGEGEGEHSTDSKLGGKTEKNTEFGASENIFSVDLKHAAALLSKDFVRAKVLASTNGVLPDQPKKGKNVKWQMRPG